MQSSDDGGSSLSAREQAVLQHTELLALRFALAPEAAGSAPSAAATTVNGVSATSVADLTHLQRSVNGLLPSRRWWTLPVQADLSRVRVAGLTLWHRHPDTPPEAREGGHPALPELEVRVLHEHVLIGAGSAASGPAAVAAAAAGGPIDLVRRAVLAAELDASLQWLLDSLGSAGSQYPVLGLDCESDCKASSEGEVRLLQLSTGRRCLLIRVPPQREIQQFLQAHGGTPPPGQPGPLFTPAFHQLMRNKAVYKAGAELWTDALDLWFCCPNVEVNGCLNMSWIFRNAHGGALSLAAMVNLSLGASNNNAFLKDKETTVSSWGAAHLSIRQLVYAALDAQTSWVAGANQMQIPKPFDVSAIPHALLSRAARWKQILRAHRMQAEARMQQSGQSYGSGQTRNNVLAGPLSSADQHLLEATHRLLARVMQGEEPFNPWVSSLLSVAFPSDALAQQSMPQPNSKPPAADGHGSSSGATSSSSWFSSEDLVVETAALHARWFAPMQPNLDRSYLEQPFWQRLAPEQQQAIEAAEHNRIHFVFGPPGTGKCFGTGTRLLLHCGRSKAVESIVRDSLRGLPQLLLGEDSLPRRVVPGSEVRGHGELFEVCSANTGRKAWRANADHVLVLRVTRRPCMEFDAANGAGWIVSAVQLEPGADDEPEQRSLVPRLRHERFECEATASARLALLRAGWAPLRFECTVRDFVRFVPRELQHHVVMFQPAEGVQLPPPAMPLAARLQGIVGAGAPVLEELVQSTAWVLGLWVAGAARCAKHEPVRAALDTWRAAVHGGLPTQSVDNDAVLHALLGSYELLHHSEQPVCLPHDLLCEAAPVRTSLLEGLLDGGAEMHGEQQQHHQRQGVELRLRGESMLSSCIQLARGLGLVAGEVRHDEGEEAGWSCATLAGAALHKLRPLHAPKLLESGALCPTFPESSDADDAEYQSGESFTIKPVGEGAFWGFAVEGPSRCFLMEDFIVTHNSLVAAAAAAKALTRTSTLDRSAVPPDMASAPQRVLCLAESEVAARHLADALAELLPPEQLILFCSQPFLASWAEDAYPRLRMGYVHGMASAEEGEGAGSSAAVAEEHLGSDRAVLVCTLDFALSTQFPHRLLHRQTVLLDDANQVWLLKAILLLRKLPHTERLLLFGDELQLPAVLGKREVESALVAAHSASQAVDASFSCRETVSKAASYPPSFRRISSSLLRRQWRLLPHLSGLVTSLFYPETPMDVLEAGNRSRVLGWVDVRGGRAVEEEQRGQRDEGEEGEELAGGGRAEGFSNQAEIDRLVLLWNSYAERPGFTADQIAILCLHAAQRRRLLEQQPEMSSRTFLVEEFQGQQTQVVLLSLSALRHTSRMNEAHRINVALTRAASKLFLLGDRNALSASPGAKDSLWSIVSDYEALDLEDIWPDLALSQEAFPALPGAANVTPSSRSPVLQPAAAPALAPAASVPQIDLQLIQALGAAMRAPEASSLLPDGSPAGWVPLSLLGDVFALVHGQPFSAYTLAAPAEFVRAYKEFFLLSDPDAEEPWVSFQDASAAAQAPAQAASAASVVSAAAADASNSAAAASGPKTVFADSRSVLIPSSKTAAPRALHSFAPVPSNAWKSQLCTLYHPPETKGAVSHKFKPACFNSAEKCGFIHGDFWVRTDRITARGEREYWCITPGSRTIHVDTVRDGNAATGKKSARLLQLEALIDSPHNRAQWKKHASELAIYDLPPQTVHAPAPVPAASSQAASVSVAPPVPIPVPVPRPVAPVPVMPAPSASQAGLDTVPQKDGASVSATELGASEADEAERQRRKDRAAEKKERLKREKEERRAAAAAAAAKTEDDDAAAPSGDEDAQADDFVEVSARRAFKHPTNLAAALAAELREPEAPTQLVCPFCKSGMPLDARLCSQCGSELGAGGGVVASPSPREADKTEVQAVAEEQPTETPPQAQAQVQAKQDKEKAKAPTSAPASPAKASAASAAEKDADAESVVSAASSAAPSSAAASAPPSVYPATMEAGSYLTAADVVSLSKNARKKLLWLCPSCLAPNEGSAQQCILDGAHKPHGPEIRFAHPKEQAAAAASVPAQVINGHRIEYESDDVRLLVSGSSTTLVAKRPLRAGSVVLLDHTMYTRSESRQSASSSCPSPEQVTQLCKMLMADAVQTAHLERLAARVQSSGDPLPNPDGGLTWSLALSGCKRPKNVSLGVWQQAILAACKATFQREGECACVHGRFNMPREARFLSASCWPNCAVVKRHKPTSDEELDAAAPSGQDCKDYKNVHAVLVTGDVEAGATLTEVCAPKGLGTAWLSLPADHRTATLEEALDDDEFLCECARCMSSGKKKTVAGVEADKLLRLELPGFSLKGSALVDDFESALDDYATLRSSYELVMSPSEMQKLRAKGDVRSRQLLDTGVSDAQWEQDLLLLLEYLLAFTLEHPLSRTHWRMQRVRQMYMQLAFKHELYLNKQVHVGPGARQHGSSHHEDSDEGASDGDEGDDDADKQSKKRTHAHGEAEDAAADALSPEEKRLQDRAGAVKGKDSASATTLSSGKKRKIASGVVAPAANGDSGAASSAASSSASSSSPASPAEWDPYPIRLHCMLHVVAESIRSNAQFYRAMEPAKSLPLDLLDRIEAALRKERIVLQPEPGALERLHNLTARGLSADDPESWRDEAGQFELPLLCFEGMGTQAGQDAFFHHLRTKVEPNADKLKALGYPRRINTPVW